MIVVIRDIEAAISNANLLSETGISAVPLPVLRYDPIPFNNSMFQISYQALIFTSKHGILHQNSFYDLPTWCVGSTTAKVAKNAGYTNIVTSSDSAQTLAENISSQIDSSKGPLLWISGEDIAFDIETYLVNKKFDINRVITYRMTPINYLPNWFKKLVKSNKITGIIVLSKRNFQCFRELMIAENIWQYHKKWHLFTFDKIQFVPEEISLFSGIKKSKTASFDYLFKVIKDWYSISGQSF